MANRPTNRLFDPPTARPIAQASMCDKSSYQTNTPPRDPSNTRPPMVEHRCSCGRTVAIVAGARAWCTRCGKPMRPAKGGDDGPSPR